MRLDVQCAVFCLGMDYLEKMLSGPQNGTTVAAVTSSDQPLCGLMHFPKVKC